MFGLVLALLWAAFTGNVHTYDNPGQQGVYVQLDGTHCVGFEYVGDAGPGFFGNTLGLSGGDCQ